MKRRNWLRGFLIVLAVVLAILGALAGAAYYALSRFDVRAEIARTVSQATGRTLAIDGKVGVTLYPVLGLRAERARFANVPGGRAPALATFDAVSIGVEPWPLIRRRVLVVRELALDGPRIALELDSAGAPNWVMTPQRQAAVSAPAEMQPQDVTLRAVHIRHGALTYYDARTRQGWSVSDVDLDTALQGLDAPMEIKGKLAYADQPVDIDAVIGAPRAVMAGRTTAIRGHVSSPLVASTFDGQLDPALGVFAGQVQAQGASLRRLLAWLVAPIQPGYGLEAFNVNGRLTTGARELKFENASLTFDAVRSRGDFTLSELRGKPYVSGRLEVFDLDVNPYLAAAQQPAAPAPQVAQAAAEPRRGLDVETAPSEQPFDFSGLKAVNADLELTTHTLRVQQLKLDRTQLSLVVNDGYLAATLNEVALYGGTGRGRLELDAREPALRIVEELVADGLDSNAFLTDAINLPMIAGRAEVNMRFAAQGRTQAELIRTLDGRLSFELVSGELRGVDLGGVATTISRALNNRLVAPTARTPLQGMSATFAVADGVMASDSLSFNTPDLRLRGLGVLDLSARALDIRLAPQGTLLAIPFRVFGPWDRIGYAADIGGGARRALETRIAAVRQNR